jgi:hypothetical protein
MTGCKLACEGCTLRVHSALPSSQLTSSLNARTSSAKGLSASQAFLMRSLMRLSAQSCDGRGSSTAQRGDSDVDSGPAT